MDFRLVYPILAILNRLCVNCALSVNLKLNKYNTIQYNREFNHDVVCMLVYYSQLFTNKLT